MEADLLLHPTVRRQVVFLQQSSSCRVQGLQRGSRGACENSFLLEVPFCWQFLRWQVHFQRFGTTWVPDVLFLGEDDFSPLTPDSHPSAAALRTGLDNWDDRDAHQLQNLIHALLMRYSDYQREKMQALAARDSRLQFELATAIGLRDDGGGPQMLVQNLGEGMQKAVFSMPVEGVDLSPLQPFLSRMWSTSGGFPAIALQDMERGVTLVAEYLITSSSGSSGGAPDLDLHLPQQLTGVMGVPQLPTWSSGMCLMEYLPMCADAINRHVTAAAENASLRQGLLTALTETGLSWPLDIDARTCRSASFQMKHEGIGFQVYISIPDHFPEDQPLIALQRVEGGTAESATFQKYAWSPRWSTKEMARRIYAFLQEEIPKHHPGYEPPKAPFSLSVPSPRTPASHSFPRAASPAPVSQSPVTSPESSSSTTSERSTRHEKNAFGRLLDKLK